MIRTYKHGIEVVFVAACDSKEIGQIFSKNDVSHVICVEKSRTVKDSAAIEFTKRFYYEIFTGK